MGRKVESQPGEAYFISFLMISVVACGLSRIFAIIFFGEEGTLSYTGDMLIIVLPSLLLLFFLPASKIIRKNTTKAWTILFVIGVLSILAYAFWYLNALANGFGNLT